MVFVLLVIQSSLKILNEAPFINFIRRNRHILVWWKKKKQKDLAENVLSDTESDGRAAASKIKISQNFFSTSLFIWNLSEYSRIFKNVSEDSRRFSNIFFNFQKVL